MINRPQSATTQARTLLSEREVDRIIQSCNIGLVQVTKEYDMLNEMVENRKKNIEKARKQQVSEEKLSREIRIDCDEIEFRQGIEDQMCKFIRQLLQGECLEQLEQEISKQQSTEVFWNCIRCGFTQREGENEETCVYHRGKLKYYSCRLCGQDEYFTCCNRCRDCLVGCTTGLHKQ